MTFIIFIPDLTTKEIGQENPLSTIILRYL